MLVIERDIETRNSDHPVTDQPRLDRLLVALIDKIECGILACTGSGELLHANLAAQRELRHGRMLALVDRQVRCVDGPRGAWAAALREAAAGNRSELITLGHAPDQLTVAISPVPLDRSGEPGAVVLMGRRSACSTLGLELLAKQYSLTYSESRVLRGLIGKNTPREIADAHRVSVSTVRTQVQSIRDKLGVRSVEALLLRAAEMPLVGTPY